MDDWVLCRIYKKSKHSLTSITEASQTVEVKEQDEAEEEEQMKETFSFSPPLLLPTPQATLISQKSLSFSNLLDATDFSMLRTILSENHNNSTNYPNTTLFNSENLDHETPQNFYTNNTDINNSTCFVQKNPSVISNMDENMMYPPKKHHSSSYCNFANTTLQNQNPQWNFMFKQPHMNRQLLPGPQYLQFQ